MILIFRISEERKQNRTFVVKEISKNDFLTENDV
jgi:hypothetical protein